MNIVKKPVFHLPLYLFPLCCLIIVAIFHLKTGIAIHNFMREPQAVVGVHPSVGAISNLGVLFWCASATILFFTWSIRTDVSISKNFSSFLLFSGILTAVFTLDDLYMIHDAFLPTYFGIKEIYSYLAYCLIFFFGFINFKQQILTTRYFVLLLAFAFWGGSTFIDLFDQNIEPFVGGNWRILIEDGLKLFGIVAWFDYYSMACRSHIRNSLSSKIAAGSKKQKKKTKKK